MKYIYAVLVVLIWSCQTGFSQDQRMNILRSIDRMDAIQFGASLSGRNAGESLNIHLKIPKDYEFRNQIIPGTRDQTSEKDDLGYVHERYAQYYKGIRIEQSDIRARYLNDRLISINGEYVDIPNIDISIAISKEAAIKNAMEYIGAKKYIWEDEKEYGWMKTNVENPPMSCYLDPKTVIIRNMFQPEDIVFRMSYKVDIHAIEPYGHHFVYVDAKNGNILNAVSRNDYVYGTANTRYSGTQTISTTPVIGYTHLLRGYDNSRSIETYNAQKGNSTANAVDFINIGSNNWKDPPYGNANNANAALDAHWGAMVTWDYFKQPNVHNRNSYNNQGGTLKQYVHWGVNIPSAAANRSGNYIWYGDGDPNHPDWPSFPYVALDVVAHEFGHLVNNHSAKVGWNSNYDESAVINEGLSDIWGACVKYYANNLFSGLGKNIWLHGAERGNIPRCFVDPKNQAIGRMCDTYKDNFWFGESVYSQAGVLRHWFYILSAGKSGTNGHGFTYNVSGIGIAKAEKIVYRALTFWMTANNDFANTRTHTIQAATELYGPNSNEVITVINAWYAVGVCFPTSAFTNQTISASMSICCTGTLTISDVVIPSGVTVNIHAQDAVILEPGFHAETGSNVTITAGQLAGSNAMAPSLTQYKSNVSITDDKILLENLNLQGTKENSIDFMEHNFDFAVYPNPNDGNFIIAITNTEAANYLVEIFNISGVLVSKENSSVNHLNINISDLSKGIYFVRVTIGNNVATNKLIIQ